MWRFIALRGVSALAVVLVMSGCADVDYCGGVDCDDGNECTVDSCNSADGRCANTRVDDGTPCVFGALPGVCESGLCVDAMLCAGVDCGANRCAIDAPPCDPYTGGCPTPTKVTPAGTICDWATVDDGLCDGAGNCVEPRGDLEPVGIGFDENNLLQVIIINRSLLVVPENVGNVQVFVDGEPVADVDLGTLPDDSYRQVGSEQRISLGLRIAGQERRIAVAVDTANEILETNEDHNRFSRTITPPVISGPDLVVSALHVDQGSGALAIEIRNDGTEDSTVASVQLEIEVNEVATASVTESLPALEPGGGSILLSPTPAIPIAMGDKVRVSLDTGDPLDEIDKSNQSRTEFFPDDAALAGYDALLLDPKIRDNLKWESSTGDGSLSDEQMAGLLAAIRGLEVGRPASDPLPPVELSTGLSEEAAWYIFVAHAAHSLWVEKNGLVTWSLLDMTNEQLASMLDGREWFVYLRDRDQYSVRYAWVTPWNPSASYQFLSNFEMLKATQVETIHALTDWARARLSHSSNEDPLEQWGYEGYPPVDRVLYALEGRRHITRGCGGTTGLYVTMLRAINIPTELETIRLGDGWHCRPSFPSAELSMPHGDDPYTSYFINSSRTVPVGDMFFSTDEMENWFLDPVPDCNESICNTVGEQALHNKARIQIQRSFDRRGDYLLREYGLGGPERLHDGVLQGIELGGEVVTYAHPLFSDAEKEAMIADIEGHLVALGGGDIEVGKSLVALRLSVWNLAKNSVSGRQLKSVEDPSLDLELDRCTACP
ncbi:MAG: hypothetical protein ACN4G0_16780 [Polyangiales bacterium]